MLFVECKHKQIGGLTYGADDVRHVRDAGAGGSSEVKDFRAGSDVNFVDTSKNSSGKLGPE